MLDCSGLGPLDLLVALAEVKRKGPHCNDIARLSSATTAPSTRGLMPADPNALLTLAENIPGHVESAK